MNLVVSALQGLAAIPTLVSYLREVASALKQANRLAILREASELKGLADKAETDEDFKNLTRKLYDLSN